MSVPSACVFLSEAVMVAGEMIVDTSPSDMNGEGIFVIGERPGAPHKRGNGLSQGKVDTFDISGFDSAREAECLEGIASAGWVR